MKPYTVEAHDPNDQPRRIRSRRRFATEPEARDYAANLAASKGWCSSVTLRKPATV